MRAKSHGMAPITELNESNSRYMRRPSDQHTKLTVASGTLRVVLGERHYDLLEGDALYYDAACEH
ncbi:hypothetical protein [Geobacillus sp. TFV-3]|uniref:hypothetical protein n=1 Tax=Geobacillus sp. TFV-3 TaxID=1897059 RepID=UPI001357B86A|nr:hypothetical protein [Geobacillus sp. TFV-3]KAF0996080.1 hypothetical protein BJQ97_02743 [Geobacillus sp. TFV-3]